MSDAKTPVTDDPYDDGFVGAGRPLGAFLSPISDEDARRLEEAWNDMSFHNAVMNEGIATAGYVPPPVNPNRALIPSRDEIGSLPRWARVAFAARCARRVLPSAMKLWSATFKRHLPGLDRVVRAVERAAAVGSLMGAALDATAIDDIFAATTSDNPADYAAGVAYSAVATATMADATDSTAYAAAAVSDTFMGLARVAAIGTVCDLATLAVDFERLFWRAKVEKWTDDTPVPPSVFGPMWEGTPPAWWTDDVLAGLPPEPAIELNKSSKQQAAPVEDATQPK